MFKNTINLFGDPLPSDKYFDLADIIKKYSELSQKNSKIILDSWENALNSLKKHIENSPNLASFTRKSLSEFLKISEKTVEKLIFTPFVKKVEINFKLEISQKTQKDLENLLLILRNNYRPLLPIDLFPKRGKIFDFDTEYQFSGQKKWEKIGYRLKILKSVKIAEFSIFGTLKGKLIMQIIDSGEKKILFQETLGNINTIYQDFELKFEGIDVFLPQNKEVLLMVDYEGLGSFQATKGTRKKRVIEGLIEATPIVEWKNRYSISKRALKMRLKIY